MALPSYPLALQWEPRGWGISHFLGKRPLQPWNIRSLTNFFNHAPQTQFPSYRRAMSIFLDIKGSFELPIIFLRALSWWSCVSHIKQRISSSAALNCVDHNHVPSQIGFLKLTGADESFCIRLTSSANHYFVYMYAQ